MSLARMKAARFGSSRSMRLVWPRCSERGELTICLLLGEDARGFGRGDDSLSESAQAAGLPTAQGQPLVHYAPEIDVKIGFVSVA